MDNLTLYSSNVTISESEKDPDILIGKFIISDFSVNKNDVQLNRDTIEDWVSTLKDKPLVGKIKKTLVGSDFTGHNMKVTEVKGENGKKYKVAEFDTSAFGTFTNVSIQTIDDHEYIVAECKIWKRFTEACNIICKRAEEGTLHTSWEINVLKSHKKNKVKVIDKGCFEGHCLLGELVSPAYDCSGLLAVAEEQKDTEDLSNALMNDLISEENSELNKNNAEGGNNLENQEEKVIESAEQTDNTDSAEKEVASLTICDIRKGLYKAISGIDAGLCYDICFIYPEDHRCIYRVYGQNTNDDDFMEVSYEIKDDVVSLVGEPVAKKMVFVDVASMEEKDGHIASLTTDKAELTDKVENLEKDIASKNDALVKANDKTVELNGKIEELDKQIAELQVCKDELDKINAEKEANELAEKKNSLKEKALKSKLISEEEFETSEDVKSAIENLDENGLNKIIANRYMDSLDSQIETSSVKHEKITKEVSAQEIRDGKSLMKNYLK